MKKDNKFGKKSELSVKLAKSGKTGQRETKEVLAELVGRLREKLNPKVAAVSPSEEHRRGDLKANLDRLTVGWIWETNGATTAFWIWEEKRWPKDNCGQRSRILQNSSSR